MQQLASYLSGAWQTGTGPRAYHPSRHQRRSAMGSHQRGSGYGAGATLRD
ncbi:hypothetical protein QYS46_15800 [Klebsiella michiganensis]|nr:hypothetical protein [Klebsiella michiganensis]